MSEEKTTPSLAFDLTDTANALRLEKLMRELQERPIVCARFAVFFGRSGVGKTCAGVAMSKKFDAVYIKLGRSWNERHFCQTILQELGGGWIERGTIAKITGLIIQRLKDDSKTSDGGRKIIIIDEADYFLDERRGMVKSTLEIVREIHDDCDVGIVLLGDKRLPGKLHHLEMLHNRTPNIVEAKPATVADFRSLQKFFFPELNITDAAVVAVRKQVENILRRGVNAFYDLWQHAKINGLNEIDVIHGENAAKKPVVYLPIAIASPSHVDLVEPMADDKK